MNRIKNDDYSLFFFKQKTAYELRISDWSSDVCSSDLPQHAATRRPARGRARHGRPQGHEEETLGKPWPARLAIPGAARSPHEETQAQSLREASRTDAARTRRHGALARAHGQASAGAARRQIGRAHV